MPRPAFGGSRRPNRTDFLGQKEIPDSFCARQISFSSNEKSIFLWCFAMTCKAAGLASIFLLGRLGIPPLEPPCRAVLAWAGGFFGELSARKICLWEIFMSCGVSCRKMLVSHILRYSHYHYIIFELQTQEEY